jgi:dienelactone hydrolase
VQLRRYVARRACFVVISMRCAQREQPAAVSSLSAASALKTRVLHYMQAHHTDAFRQSIASVLGAPPDSSPLAAEVLEVEAQAGYRQERVRYQVSPGDYSYAYLLIPDNIRQPAPAVYIHHRHNFKQSKREVVGLEGDPNYALGLELARFGLIIFAPDMLGYGERRSPESLKDGADDSADLSYKFQQLSLRLLRGETLLKKVLWDVSRGVDYLETRPEIAKAFIGVMGVGFGGKLALWSAALDTRFRAVVVHDGAATYRDMIKRGERLQPELVVPRLMQVADSHHIMSLIAPRPLLISALTDGKQHNDAVESFNKVVPLYAMLGAANRVSLYQYPQEGGAPSRQMRYNAYHWLNSWLRPA